MTRLNLMLCRCAILWLGVSAGSVDAGTAEDAMRLLKTNCLSCHNEAKHKGGLKLDSREGLIKGGGEGPVIVEGKPEESSFIKSLAADADPHMPPKKQLSGEQIEVFAAWIRDSAPWNAAALEEESAPRPVSLAALPRDFHPVMAMALSSDGTRLAAGCGNEVLLFASGPAALVLKARSRAHLDAVQSMAWMPDGKRLVTGSFRRVVIWNAEELQQEREITAGLTDRITALQVLPGGGQVLLADGSVAERGVVRVMDAANGQIVRSWKAHGDTIFSMALTADGKTLATAGGDKLVRFWETDSGREIMKLEAHATQVLSLAFNPDQTQLITAGADRQLKVWDVKTRENTVALTGKSAAYNAVAWTAAGPSVLAAMDDGALLRYSDLKAHTGAQSSDTGNEKQVGRADSPLYCVAASADGTRVWAGSSGGRILGWDKDGKLVDSFDPLELKPGSAAPVP